MILFLKTQEEIEGFRKAGKEAARILRILREKTHTGMTTADLDEIMRTECQRIDATPTFLNYNGFPASLCTSVNKVLVHGVPNARKLETDDLLSIDLGVTIDGFIGDTATTFPVREEHFSISVPEMWPGFTCLGDLRNCIGVTGRVGDPSSVKYISPLTPELTLVLACREALSGGIEKARAGNRLSDISGAICEVANGYGFSMPVQYGGHGVNRFCLHAQPFIPNDPQLMEEDVTLCPGMVLAIEPMFMDSKSNRVTVLADGWSVAAQGNAAHFEHTIAVTDGDPLILTEEV